MLMIPPGSVERQIRARLPAIRFLQVYLPLPVSRWLLRQGMARVRLVAAVTRQAVSVDGAPLALEGSPRGDAASNPRFVGDGCSVDGAPLAAAAGPAVAARADGGRTDEPPVGSRVSCEWLTPRDCPNDQALLYLHGGGFVYGLTPPHLEMVAYLAQKMSIRALLVDYRLAPDHPFPAPLDDCVTAYRWLLEQGICARNIVVAGDSAGGNLTITSLMKLRDSGDPLPAAAACLSPVADFSGSGSAAAGFNDPLLPPRAGKRYREAYVAHHDARDPLISPVYGDWHGLPPLLVHAGEDEILRHDAVRIEGLAKAAGVDVRLEIFPRMWHVWQLFLTLPQAVQSLDEIAQFLRSHLGPATR